MPTVPLSNNKVQRRSLNVETMKVASLSPEIVGNNVYDAQQKLSREIGKLGQAAIDYGLREQEKESEKKVLSSSTAAFGEIDNLLYDTNADDEGKPKGILNRKLGQVGSDSVIEYDKGVQSVIDKYSADLTDKQKEKLYASVGTHSRALRDNVAKHQASESNKDLDNRFLAQSQLQIGTAAAVDSDDTLSELIGSTHLTIQNSLKAKGLDDGSIKLEQNKATDKMIELNISSRLESNPDAAKRTLENFKDTVSPEFYQKTTQIIDGKRFENTRSGLYDSVFKSMKLSDGEPDVARINKAIDSSDKWTQSQKEQLRSYMSSRAMEDLQNKNRQDKDIINQFSNEIIKGKQQGKTLDDALKSVGKFGGDAVDMKDREDIARKLYTDPGAKSDPETVLALFEKNQTGKASKSEIRQAWSDGKLNTPDYISIMKAHIDAKIGEAKNDETLAWTGVKNLAMETFGSSKKDEMNAYLYAVKIESQGKSAEETAVIAKRLLDSTVTSKGWLWDTKETNYETTLKQQDAKNEVWGSLKLNVGNDEIKAIGSGIVRKGASSWGASDIENFAKPFGGIEAIKKGTPVNNAINSLNKNGQLVTTENVKAVLAIYKDGNY